MNERKKMNPLFLVFGCFAAFVLSGICVIGLIWVIVAFTAVKVGTEVYHAPASQEFLHGPVDEPSAGPAETPQEAAEQPASIQGTEDSPTPAQEPSEPLSPSEQPADLPKPIVPQDQRSAPPQ